jgi:hypothetical protein
MLNTLGDIQNSLFVPYTGFFDRTRKINLTKPPQDSILSPSQQAAQDRADIDAQHATDVQQDAEDEAARQENQKDAKKRKEGDPEKDLPAPPTVVNEDGTVEPHGPSEPVDTETTLVATEVVVKGKYFVLPSKLVDMSDWTEQEKADLDDYVRHLLHNRKERLRRKWRGFKKYVSTREPLLLVIYRSPV